MIRVELVSRPRWSPWSKALLSALVVGGGLYGLHHFHSSGSAPSPVVEQEVVPPSPVVEQETTPSPVQEATPSPVTQQEITPESAAEQGTAPSPAAQQEAAPSPVVVQQEIESSSAVAQETVSSPVAEKEKTTEPVVQQEASPGMQQDTTSSSAQEAVPSPVAQRDTTPRPQEIAPRKAPPRPVTSAPAHQRSTACHQAMQIAQQVPAGIRVASLNCNSTGEYWLEGATPSHTVLRTFRLRLQALPSRVSFSTWREERTLRFAFQGRFAEQVPPPRTALSSGQAEQFLGKVARWADASGLDSLSIHEPIHLRSSSRIQQRQKLRGIGAPQQIDAFLQQFQQAEGVATLGEVLLMPVKSDEHGWVKARLYAAVDIVVDEP